ncbi:MAG: hypothetical protein CMI13_04510 [Oleibacter sp.]|nr:hypothetical protein [Thalassolituus sp.]
MKSETDSSMQQTSDRIQQLWQRLQTVGGFSYRSSPGPASKTGWFGGGEGKVEVRVISDSELHYIETGTFTLDGQQPVDMYNTYIWSKSAQGIRLSHGRRGEPVFLFELTVAEADGLWRSVEAHVCIDDLYSGELQESAEGFTLQWTITGPKKDEHLLYHYRIV